MHRWIAEHRLSIRFKLVLLLGLSAAIALFISSAITLMSTFLTEREESLRTLRQLAEVSSENLRAALAFRDDASAARLLQPLQKNRQIRLAVVDDETGKTFSSYVAADPLGSICASCERLLAEVRHAERTRTQADAATIEHMDFDYTVVLQPIIFDGQPIGSLTIISDNAALQDKVVRHLLFQALVSVATLVILVLISLRLQRLFTRPIFDLISAMRDVSQTKNYALRVTSLQNDEFHDLYTGFNSMLDEIRDRDTQLSKLATTDALTGLANRRQVMEELCSVLVRAARKHEPLGVIMLDIDHFKKINDSLGHPVGDIALRGVAHIVAASAREYDMVARIGGEEFLVVCDSSDLPATVAVAERIRHGIEQATFVYDGGKMQVTVSLGVFAAVPESEESEVFIKAADDALYRAKQAGRNRVEIGRR